MTRGGAEAIKAALRRSLPLILILVALGAIAMNAFTQLRGARYEATTRVLLTTSEVTSLLTGTQPVFVDPTQLHDTAVALAGSPELYARVAKADAGRYGSATEVEAMTKVSGQDDNIVGFTVTSDDPTKAVAVANSVASQYIRWREELQTDQIRRAIVALQQRISRQPAGSARRADLEQRLTELQVLESVPTANAVLVERATSAPQTSPAPIRDTLLGAMIGLLLALLLVGIREGLDTKIRSEEDIEELLDTPVLATVQSLPRRARLVMFGRNEGLYGDAYGLLAANLVQASRASEGLTIAVTSAIASEGKTSTIANLAVALARRGANVVLADFDVRKPSLAEVFRIPADAPGVTQLVSGRAAPGEVLWRVSLNGKNVPAAIAPGLIATNGNEASSLEGSLSVVPAGSALRSGSLSQSPRVASALDELRKSAGADILLLDTPPALVTVEMAELARNVDSVIVVVRQGRVSRRSLRALSRQMQSWRSKLAGAVLTDTPLEERHSYYSRTG